METEKGLVAIIMAGGLGKRMNSDLPKVLHKIAGVPMICHILTKLTDLSSVKATLPSVKKIMIVVGKYKQIIEETINYFLQ
jgi:bifunctional N-acetylglucosamine-1-phosphate-uridyltransferase/glucosamine-1-phosphate-acetyltransferase GlmU-like protein